MTNAIPAGFTSGPPPKDKPGNYAVRSHLQSQSWGVWDGQSLTANGSGWFGSESIVAHYQLPPDPPPLPRRFRCARKSDGKALVGVFVNGVDVGQPFKTFTANGETNWDDDDAFNRKFTITEWIDPE
jgi:hypothetical protein